MAGTAGLDVHRYSLSLSAAILNPGQSALDAEKIVADCGVAESIRRLMGRLGDPNPSLVWACYEAGPTG